ncbi:hypothetical protein K4F52_009545 [Lecanicillium sp. MT-2017a]|nr:hypothetical protein K4F52_009545 [Lecanicillium sp. MT-2017a]
MPLRSAVAAALVLAGTATAADCSNNLKVDYPAPVAAKGWTYQLVAQNFTKPRGIAFDKDGGLLVIDSGAGLVHLKLKDDGDTCVSVDERKTLLESEDLNHGLALSDDGKTLYASSSDKVFSWSYDSKALSLSDSNQTLVTNMSNSDHTTRTLLMSKKQPGTLLVSRGSQSNEDDNTRDIESGHSQIRSFDLTKLDSDSDPYQFLDGHVLGWGLRNSVGVAEDSNGGIWSVENSVDELSRKGEDIHRDNPAEELNYHGNIGKPDDDDQGGNYGYPVCYAIWGTENFPEPGKLSVADQFPDDDAPGNVTDDACNDEYVSPRLAFQAHTAPLDIKFDDKDEHAYISFHGSWNREDPVGYKIARVAFKDGQPTAAHDSKDAAMDILSTEDLSQCPDNCFRPVGLAWDSNGRLWFSSDATGEIFVMKNDGSGGDGGNGGDSAAASVAPALTLVGCAAAAVAAMLM